MPELDDDEYLQDIWRDCGLRKAGEHIAPLEWRELQAYSDVTGTRLTHEEWRIVMEMSVSYCVGLSSRNPLSMSPVDKAARDE